MRILVVEDDAQLAESISLMLAPEGYAVETTGLGEEALSLAKLYDFDLIVLDLLLPDLDGYQVIKDLRGQRIETPILILSGLGEMDSKLKGFGFGADDYVTKPFDTRELAARIQAIVRRAKGHADSLIRTGRLAVNLQTNQAFVDNKPVHLTGKEYAILELLALRKGTTLTKEMCLNQLYSGMDEPELKIIDVFVCKLRKKLAQASGGEAFIQTVWGHGYMLPDMPVPETDPVAAEPPVPESALGARQAS